MTERMWNWPGLIIPLALSAIGVWLWRQYGFEPLDRWELPLAAWINGLTGRSEWFDRIVIMLNHKPGEALFVVIIFAAFWGFIRLVRPDLSWVRIGTFAVLVFVIWFIADNVGGMIEDRMPRNSPSYVIGDGFVDLEEVRETEVKTSSPTSFPSNHGSVFFMVFFMLLYRFGWPALWMFPLCLLLSTPRVFTGAHWMGDTLIGSALVTATLSALVVATPIFRAYLAYERWIDGKLRPA